MRSVWMGLGWQVQEAKATARKEGEDVMGSSTAPEFLPHVALAPTAELCSQEDRVWGGKKPVFWSWPYAM